jgi:hypothetical protein
LFMLSSFYDAPLGISKAVFKFGLEATMLIRLGGPGG